MHGATNLRLKGTRFHFRRKIPYTLRERFGRCEVVISLQTGKLRLARARAREVWLAVEEAIVKARDDVTVTREQIDAILKRAMEAINWADEVRLARTGQIYDHHGDAPLDADALILETDADNYRRALASNDISPAREMAHRYSTDMGLVVDADSTNERLIGRALLRLLAAKSEETARRLRDEVYRC